MRIINSESKDALDEAIRVLLDGGIIAYPTDTFYALGVKFDIEMSLRNIYTLKGRPKDKAMPIIIGSAEALDMVAKPINRASKTLMEKYWPGPLTLLLDAADGMSGLLAADGKVAVREPGESFAFLLAREAGFPITATSANPSGLPPASTAEEVLDYFGESVDLVIDGGATKGGLPSTIVDATGADVKILRDGAVKISLP